MIHISMEGEITHLDVEELIDIGFGADVYTVSAQELFNIMRRHDELQRQGRAMIDMLKKGRIKIRGAK